MGGRSGGAIGARVGAALPDEEGATAAGVPVAAGVSEVVEEA